MLRPEWEFVSQTKYGYLQLITSNLRALIKFHVCLVNFHKPIEISDKQHHMIQFNSSILRGILDAIITSPLYPDINSQNDIASYIGRSDSSISKALNPANTNGANDICQLILDRFNVVRIDGVYQVVGIEQDPRLEELAKKLALNLVDISTEFTKQNKPHLAVLKDQELKSELKTNPNRPRERFIVVTGAGASHSATGGKMMLADQAAEHIRSTLTSDADKLLQQLVNEEIKRQKYVYRASTETFEATLLAYSKFKKEELLKILKEICGDRHLPSFGYEILAHMLKHRIVDGIINFNYDEVLENAIEDELPEKNYSYIFSDGHCPNEYEDLLIGKRLKQPIVIKPHGTISHTSSLRFIGESVFTMVPEIRDIIYKLFAGPVKKSNPNSNIQDYIPLNLIIIGFGMNSPEFNGIIKEYFKEFPDRTIKFWIFDHKSRFKDFETSFQKEEIDRIEKHSVFFNLRNDASFTRVFFSLWNLIAECFNPEYVPRGIDRHQLVSTLLDTYHHTLIGGPGKKGKKKEG